jgi:hypothetical protein
MGEITLKPGETRKLVSQPGPNESYNLAVAGADVFLSHRKGLVVREGKRVRPGDRVTVENLEGKPLYAKNPGENTSNATLNINEAAFGLFFQPRAVQASVQASEQNEAAPATDDFRNATASGESIGSGGSETVTLNPPGRSTQLSLYVDATAGIEVTVTWNNTSQTFAANPVQEVLPVYYIEDPITVQITDVSGGANTVSYDMAVV